MSKFIPGGYFLISRQIFTSPIWLKPPQYLRLFMWLVGNANHQDQEIRGMFYKRGGLVITYDEIIKAMSHYYNHKNIVPTVKQIRVMLNWLVSENMIEIHPLRPSNSPTRADSRAEARAHVGINIIVVNYDTYQNPENYKGRDKGRGISPLGHNNNNGEQCNKKSRGDISDISQEITALVDELFPTDVDKEIFSAVRDAIASTRKSHRVSDSIILTQLKKWAKYPRNQVHRGIQRYLDKRCHEERKSENYLLGIIRNTQEEMADDSRFDHWDKYL